jgi:hypothetical protein
MANTNLRATEVRIKDKNFKQYKGTVECGCGEHPFVYGTESGKDKEFETLICKKCGEQMKVKNDGKAN